MVINGNVTITNHNRKCPQILPKVIGDGGSDGDGSRIVWYVYATQCVEYYSVLALYDTITYYTHTHTSVDRSMHLGWVINVDSLESRNSRNPHTDS